MEEDGTDIFGFRHLRKVADPWPGPQGAKAHPNQLLIVAWAAPPQFLGIAWLQLQTPAWALLIAHWAALTAVLCMPVRWKAVATGEMPSHLWKDIIPECILNISETCDVLLRLNHVLLKLTQLEFTYNLSDISDQWLMVIALVFWFWFSELCRGLRYSLKKQ